jgi:hypothetical protein
VLVVSAPAIYLVGTSRRSIVEATHSSPTSASRLVSWVSGLKSTAKFASLIESQGNLKPRPDASAAPILAEKKFRNAAQEEFASEAHFINPVPSVSSQWQYVPAVGHTGEPHQDQERAGEIAVHAPATPSVDQTHPAAMTPI